MDPKTSITELLASLRWDVDQCVTNYDGEQVWMGPALDEQGNRIGITECCLANDPCDHHAALAKQQEKN
jgi:hypothetical protein